MQSEVQARIVSLVINAGSRLGEGVVQEVRRELEGRGVEVKTACVVSDGSRLQEAIQSAAGDGDHIVAVGGGDGTIYTAVNVIGASDRILGVIPLGTGNDFARTLAIPTDIPAACDIIARCSPHRVDLGQAGDRYFVNVASLGLSTQVVHQTTPGLKRLFGTLAYALSGLREISSFDPFRANLNTGGKQFDIETRLIVVGNGRYHAAGRLLAPGASIVDGELVVYSPIGNRQADLIRFALAGLSGRHLQEPNVLSFTTREVHIVADPPQEIEIDGELATRTPITFRVVPCALRVLAPAVDA